MTIALIRNEIAAKKSLPFDRGSFEVLRRKERQYPFYAVGFLGIAPRPSPQLPMPLAH